MRMISVFVLALGLAASTAFAVPFGNWKEQGFPRHP